MIFIVHGPCIIWKEGNEQFGTSDVVIVENRYSTAAEKLYPVHASFGKRKINNLAHAHQMAGIVENRFATGGKNYL